LAQKIKAGAVSYLNTKPLIYGFEQGKMEDELELIIEYPSKIAVLLQSDEIDIGLVPVAIIPSLKEYHIISEYCIGCDGEVASVCLFSDVSLQEIENILLDYQSRTSVSLLKILLKEHWKISPTLIAGNEHYENNIAGKTAGLVIGDRALKQRSKSKYIYDLGIAWKEMTGLPFVFAAWVANKSLPKSFTNAFNITTGEGLAHLKEIVSENNFDSFDLFAYYKNNIDYRLDNDKKKALDLFLSKIANGGL
jgi:chorismate dehydratase